MTSRLPFFRVGLTLTLLAMVACPAHAQEHHDEHALGKVDFPVSCSAPAQEKFNRAMALLHHMTYPQAREAFEQVVALEPSCAMAYWGVAMTLFQPLWPTRPSPAALTRGWESVQKAKALHPPTQPRTAVRCRGGLGFGVASLPLNSAQLSNVM